MGGHRAGCSAGSGDALVWTLLFPGAVGSGRGVRRCEGHASRTPVPWAPEGVPGAAVASRLAAAPFLSRASQAGCICRLWSARLAPWLFPLGLRPLFLETLPWGPGAVASRLGARSVCAGTAAATCECGQTPGAASLQGAGTDGCQRRAGQFSAGCPAQPRPCSETGTASGFRARAQGRARRREEATASGCVHTRVSVGVSALWLIVLCV